MFYLFFSVKSISVAFIKLFEFTGKSFANNYKQYRKLIQKDSKRSYNQYILFKITAAACHASGFWRVHLSARLSGLVTITGQIAQRAEHASFIKHFTT